jgi:O-antigen ligase
LIMIAPSTDPLSRRLRAFAYAALWLMLLVAPFPASAGLRGGLLLLAAIALTVALLRMRDHGSLASINFPSTLCVAAALVWIISVAIFSALGPDPRSSLNAWRGDVLAPALACGSFYALTTTRPKLIGFSVALLIGVVALSIMLVHDPFRPEDATHTALYGGVGRVTMWFTTLASLLPLAWLAPRRWRTVARVGCVVAVIAILVGTWYSGNRATWISFAAMLLVGTLAANWSAKPRGISVRGLVVLVPLLAVLCVGFYASATYRANVHTANSETPVEFLLKDNRGGIWRTALEMIEEKPWLGHGYDLDRVGDDFTSRLNDPRLRGFIRHGHNVLLDYAIQMGVIAAAILALLFVVLFREFWRLAGSQKNERDQLARIAAICGVALITGVLARNMVDDFFSRHMILLFGAMIGMLLGVANRSHTR